MNPDRWFAWLIRLYPRRFRRAYGHQLRTAFTAEGRRQDARRRPLGMLRLWTWLVVDTVFSAALAWLEDLRRLTIAGRRAGAPRGVLFDLRLAWRRLSSAPRFTLTAVLVLATGLGATSAVFTLAEALLVRPPPGVEHPERLVRIARTSRSTRSGVFQYPDYVYFREHATTFSDIAGYRMSPLVLVGGLGTEPRELRVMAVSDNYFDVLGVPMSAGRGFARHEDQTSGAHPVAVLSHSFWQQPLGGRSGVVGSSIRLGGHPLTVVGITREAFHGISVAEQPPDVWIPLRMLPALTSSENELFDRPATGQWRWIQPIGRLAPGVDRSAAESELAMLSAQLAAAFPRTNAGEGVRLTPNVQYSIGLQDELASTTGLFAIVAVAVALIAVANVAILFLARASGRRGEVALMVALGASRARLVRQLLTESLLLALAGGTVGALAAAWPAAILGRLLPGELHVSWRPDATVLLSALGIAVLTAVLFGLLPAIQLSRTAVSSSATSSRSSARAGSRDLLVILQVAVSVVLVVAASLFGRSLQRARAVKLGYDTHDRFAVSLRFDRRTSGTAEAQAVVQDILSRLRATPGVEAASTVAVLPFSGDWENCFGVRVAGHLAGQRTCAKFNAVGARYFAFMHQPVLRGRDFLERDTETSAHVLIVNRAAAQKIWKADDVIGRQILLPEAPDPSAGTVPWTVVGVVEDALYSELGGQADPFVYLPNRQYFLPTVNLLVLSPANPLELSAAIQDQVRIVAPGLAGRRVRTLDGLVAGQLAPYRSAALAVGLFSGVAVVLALTGLYGLLTYSVTCRTRELGIRLALGASRHDVARKVIGRGLSLVGAGLALGLGVAWLAARWTAAYLFQIPPHDILAFAVAPTILFVVALGATLPPARRAARVDPVAVLQHSAGDG